MLRFFFVLAFGFFLANSFGAPLSANQVTSSSSQFFLVSVISSLRYHRLDHAQLANNPAPFEYTTCTSFLYRNQPTNVFDARFGDRKREILPSDLLDSFILARLYD